MLPNIVTGSGDMTWTFWDGGGGRHVILPNTTNVAATSQGYFKDYVYF